MQGMSGAVFGNVLRSLQAGADPAIAQESEPLHALIRAGSSGRGGLRYIGPVRRRARLYGSGGATAAGRSRPTAQPLLHAGIRGDFQV